jgi:hypothetical protein
MLQVIDRDTQVTDLLSDPEKKWKSTSEEEEEGRKASDREVEFDTQVTDLLSDP